MATHTGSPRGPAPHPGWCWLQAPARNKVQLFTMSTGKVWASHPSRWWVFKKKETRRHSELQCLVPERITWKLWFLCVETPEWEQADLFLEAQSRFPSSWRRVGISPRPAGLPGAISCHISISVSPWLRRVNTFRQWKDLHLQGKDCWISVLRKRPAQVWSEGNHPALAWKQLHQTVTPSPPHRGCGCWDLQPWDQQQRKILETLP